MPIVPMSGNYMATDDRKLSDVILLFETEREVRRGLSALEVAKLPKTLPKILEFNVRAFPRLLYREGSRNDGDSELLLRSAREFFGRQIVE